MRNFDLSPLYRSTVGFDRMANLMDQLLTADTAQPSYPPYNIEKTGDDSYRISVAVAGFAEDDLNIEVKDGQLTITASKQDKADGDKPVYLHRGIAERGFERRFQLADHVRVSGAELDHGLLHVDLVREIPEALKPKTIAIRSTLGDKKTIDA